MSELIYGRHAVLEALRAARSAMPPPGEAKASTSRGRASSQRFLSRPRRLKFPRSIKGGLFDKLAQQARNTERCARSRRLSLRRTRRHSRSGSQRAALRSSFSTTSRTRKISARSRTAEAMAVHGVIIRNGAPLASRLPFQTPAPARSSSCQLRSPTSTAPSTPSRRRTSGLPGLDSGPDAPLLEESALTGAVAVVVGMAPRASAA